MIFKSTAFIPRLIASSYKGLGTVEKIFRVGPDPILALFFIFIFTGMVRLGVFVFCRWSQKSIESNRYLQYYWMTMANLLENILLKTGPMSITTLYRLISSRRWSRRKTKILPTSWHRYWSWLRALFKSILLSDQSSGGGSTISQQLAKIHPRKDYWICTTPINKITEMMIAFG